MNAARVTSSVKVSPTDVEARVRQLLTEARALLSVWNLYHPNFNRGTYRLLGWFSSNRGCTS